MSGAIVSGAVVSGAVVSGAPSLAQLQLPIRSVPRLADVARLGLDREFERSYLNDIVDAVAMRLDTPFVLIDVLLNTAQVFLAGHGPTPQWLQEAGGTPVEWSLCQPLILQRMPRVVTDLADDPLFQDNPMVTKVGVRAYAGVPLISHNGQVLGGLCGLDVRPRPFEPAEIRFLQDMAVETVRRLEARAVGA